MGLAFIPLYIHYLGIEAYGLIGVFAVLSTWLGLLDLGMMPTLNREMARYQGVPGGGEVLRDLLRSFELMAVGLACGVMAAMVLGADWLAGEWLRTETVSVATAANAFAIMGFIVAVRLVEGIYRSSVIGMQRQVALNGVIIATSTLRGIGGVAILALVSASLEAFFLWQGVIACLSLVALALLTYRSLPSAGRGGRFSLTSLQGVWRFAGGVLGINLLAMLLTQVDKVLLSKLLSLSDFGYFSVATTVAGALYLLITPIAQAWYPRLCELHAAGDDAGLQRVYHKGAALAAAMCGSAALVLMVFAREFLLLWTRDPGLSDRVAPLLSLFVFGTLLNCLFWLPYQMQLAHGWTRLAMRLNLLGVVILIPAILMTVPRYGAQGAGWVWVGLNAGYLLIGVQLMHTRILPGQQWRWYGKDVLLPLAGALLGLLVTEQLWAFPEGLLAQLLCLVVISGVTLVSSLLVVRYGS
ncbi:MAG: hypothetical protein RLZZ385_1632 [Pseudomonadota bacterium]